MLTTVTFIYQRYIKLFKQIVAIGNYIFMQTFNTILSKTYLSIAKIIIITSIKYLENINRTD